MKQEKPNRRESLSQLLQKQCNIASKKKPKKNLLSALSHKPPKPKPKKTKRRKRKKQGEPQFKNPWHASKKASKKKKKKAQTPATSSSQPNASSDLTLSLSQSLSPLHLNSIFLSQSQVSQDRQTQEYSISHLTFSTQEKRNTSFAPPALTPTPASSNFFQEGDILIAQESFQSDGAKPHLIASGTKLRVIEIDVMGDMSVNRVKKPWPEDTWIEKPKHSKLKPENSAPALGRYTTPNFGTPHMNQNMNKTGKPPPLALRRRNIILDQGMDDWKMDYPVFENPFFPSQEQPKPSNPTISLESRCLREFHSHASIGNGDFGTVIRAVSKLDGCTYAIKKVFVASKAEKSRKLVLKEVQVLGYLQARGGCQHIMRYHSCWWEENKLYIKLEYCAKGNVARGNLNLEQVAKLFTQITEALGYIHEHNIAHLDIKPENILIHASGDFRLADFGHAQFMNPPSDTRKRIFHIDEGDKRYLAMELLQDNFDNLWAADIFSFGLSILELVTEDLPRKGVEWQTLRRGKFIRELPEDGSPIDKETLEAMIREEASERIKARDLLNKLCEKKQVCWNEI